MLKSILKKIIYREKATSKTYIEYLRKKGNTNWRGLYYICP